MKLTLFLYAACTLPFVSKTQQLSENKTRKKKISVKKKKGARKNSKTKKYAKSTLRIFPSRTMFRLRRVALAAQKKEAENKKEMKRKILEIPNAHS